MAVGRLPQDGAPSFETGRPFTNRRNLAIGFIIVVLIVGAVSLHYKHTAVGQVLLAGGLLVGGLAIGYAAISSSKNMPAGLRAGGGDAEDLASTAFSQADIDEIRAILASSEKAHNSDNETVREHVVHCLHQMVRLAHLAATGRDKFRAAQWGLNLGRAQELLKSAGGVDAWWRAFKDIINAEDWALLKSKSETYIRLLQLDQPEEAFINRP
jgi:hypothetical protein